MSGSRLRRARPRVSVIICTYDMAREAPRTIRSAAIPYQQGINAGDFEVIVVDNGSPDPLPTAYRRRLPPQVRIVDMPEPRPSPVFAMNWAIREYARGDILLFALDGARIFTDRLYQATLAAHDQVHDALVYSLSFHLGPKEQMTSTLEGYDQKVEDRAIRASGWPGDPDGLFAISVFAGSSSNGYFRPASESNAFSVPRRLFDEVGGYDERYTSPGGGLANLELFRRYATRSDARNVCLLSEGTFHQIHGGIATSGARGFGDFNAEHVRIFGADFEHPVYESLHVGEVRPAAQRFLTLSLSSAGRTEPPSVEGYP